MKCDVCQRRLLAGEAPEAPASEVRRHLAACPACRDFQRRLVRLERNLPRLPVPPSRGKHRLLRELLGQPEPTAPVSPAPTPTLPLTPPWWRRSLIVRSAAVAAAVVLMACGVYLGVYLAEGGRAAVPVVRGPEEAPDVTPPARELVAHVLDCDLRLAEANTPRQRVETLASLADALHRETKTLTQAAGPRDLHVLAGLYERVVRDGVVARAKTLPAEDRREVIEPIRAQLARAERDARLLAQKSAPVAAPLLQMAAAARTADQQLRALMEVSQ